MIDIVEKYHEEKYLSWLKSMGLWESSFVIELSYIDAGLVDNTYLGYDEYYDTFYRYTIWDSLEEWQKTIRWMFSLSRRLKYNDKIY